VPTDIGLRRHTLDDVFLTLTRYAGAGDPHTRESSPVSAT
jgi:hypothetical protein